MASKPRESRQNCVEGNAVPKTAKPTIAPDGASRQEAAEYIAAMLVSLRFLAYGTRLPFLAYLLDIALKRPTAKKRNPIDRFIRPPCYSTKDTSCP